MLQFSLGPIPVSIHFSFALILYIAYTMTGDAVDAVIAGVGILAGVLVHESGHAMTARRFGADDVKITLFALGGVTTYPPPPGLTAGRRFLIAAAGSALAIAAGIPVLLALRADLLTNATFELIAWGFVVAGLFWGVLNWAPIRPLDGGHMLTAGLQIFMPNKGATIAKVISAIVTIVAVVLIYRNWSELMAIYVGLIGFTGLRDDPGTKPQPEPRQVPADTDPPPAFPL